MHIAYIQIFNDVIKMKRLIVIIKTLLFTSLGFGYPSGVLISDIHEITQSVTFSEQIVMIKVNPSDITQSYQSFIKNLSTDTCSFINMNNLYILSDPSGAVGSVEFPKLAHTRYFWDSTCI
jgi:hypothetical protein